MMRVCGTNNSENLGENFGRQVFEQENGVFTTLSGAFILSLNESLGIRQLKCIEIIGEIFKRLLVSKECFFQ